MKLEEKSVQHFELMDIFHKRDAAFVALLKKHLPKDKSKALISIFETSTQLPE